MRRALAWLGLLLSTACGGGGEPAAREAPRPNVLWVVWDTVRAQSMSVYGHERPTTPFLERWAEGARVFEDAVSAAAITTTSHASMFTGLLPFEHGVGNGHSRLDDSVPTLAERMSEAGYRTFLFSSNPYLGPETGLDRGFELSHRANDPAFEEAFARQRRRRVREYVRAGREPAEFQLLAASGPIAGDALIAWLEGSGDRPWFAVLNYMEAHLPLAPPRRFRERFMTPQQVRRSYEVPLHGMPVWSYTAGVIELPDEQVELARLTYDAAIAELDELFRDLLAGLEQRGHLDDTLVILTSDHGELLGEHHMWDHQYALYEELLRVPLILHHPGAVPPGRDTRPVMTLDLFRTVLALAGGEVPGPGEGGVDLRSPERHRVRLSEYQYPADLFLALVERDHPEFDRARLDRSLRSIRRDGVKYIWASDGRHELYDLRSDPREQDDLVGRRAAIAARLEADLERVTRETAAAPAAGQPARFDEKTREMLEALGYAADEAPH